MMRVKNDLVLISLVYIWFCACAAGCTFIYGLTFIGIWTDISRISLLLLLLSVVLVITFDMITIVSTTATTAVVARTITF